MKLSAGAGAFMPCAGFAGGGVVGTCALTVVAMPELAAQMAKSAAVLSRYAVLISSLSGRLCRTCRAGRTRRIASE